MVAIPIKNYNELNWFITERLVKPTANTNQRLLTYLALSLWIKRIELG